MLDTITLHLSPPDFAVTDPSRFMPSAMVAFTASPYALGARGCIRCHQNPQRNQSGGYMPKLTIIRTRQGIILRIELSLPKLMFGNNVEELDNQDFEAVQEKLVKALALMGVEVHDEALSRAEVAAIHFGKNIPLTDYSSITMIMGELQKMNLTQRLDLTRTEYRNEGHALRCHANDFELIFYDKLRDLEKARISPKRSIGGDGTRHRHILDELGLHPKIQILRMELRFAKRKKLKSVLAKLGMEQNLIFQEMFSRELAKSILLHYWQEIASDMAILAPSAAQPEDIFEALARASKGKRKAATLLRHIGAAKLVDSIGARGAKVLLSHYGGSRLCATAIKEITVQRDMLSQMRYNPTLFIGQALEEFVLLRRKPITDTSDVPPQG